MTTGPADRAIGHGGDAAGLCTRAVALCVLMLGLIAGVAPAAGIPGAAGAGVLLALGRGRLALAAGLGMLSALYFWPQTWTAAGYWVLLALLAVAALLPRRRAMPFPRLPTAALALCLIVAVAGMCLALLYRGPWLAPAVVIASLCAAGAGAGGLHRSRRGIAVSDGAGTDDLEALTRDLLLGRMTVGMVHDLAQPLNVLVMAAGNLGHIVERAEIDADSRKQLLDRSVRISSQTEGAAAILGLFRHFGRERPEEGRTIRSALERAIAATRSTHRHPGITIELTGEALDYPVHRFHDRLEMIAAAALLGGFGAYLPPDGKKRDGTLILRAVPESGGVEIVLVCADEAGEPIIGYGLDPMMHGLVQRLANGAGGEFHGPSHGDPVSQFTIRLTRGIV